MFHTLYSRIAAVLFTLMCLIGYIVYSIVLYSAEMYQQELTQKLNTTLAQHIVAEEPLFNNRQVNQSALKSLFHWLMVVNPAIELYLLDPDGKILAFTAPEGHVKRQRVSLQPIHQFIKGNIEYPYMGDDPRGLSRQKVFSAAPIPGINPDTPAGYLYVILEGEAYDSITDMIKGSYILRFTTTGLGLSLLLALITGLTAFALLTRRLRLLTTIMTGFGDKKSKSEPRFPLHGQAKDEIDLLGASFNKMADRIDQQVETLKQTDAKRREMVANVSHDLRTPLTSLHGYLETLLLKDKNLSSKERREYLEIATSQSARLNQLIGELFELAKLDSSETLINIEPFSLAELAQDVVQKFKMEAEKRNVKIMAEFGSNLPFAYGDIGLIQRVLDNLIDNALRYTPEGGHISISLQNDSDNIVVKVADTGQGIPKEEILHIFDRFYRLEKPRTTSNQNAGLGLSIVKRIIDLHGSNIKADSVPNRGTTFIFTLPTYQFT
jgi:signal transduction histidine kinase